MKRLLILTGLFSLLSFALLAQTQRTSRTNSRPHDRSTLINDSTKNANQSQADKASPEQDMDKNNPPQKSKTDPPADDKSKGSKDDKTNK